MDFYRLKCTPVVSSKSDTYPIDDEDEAYVISNGQLLSHLVGEVSEEGLDEAMLGSCYELEAPDWKSRSSSLRRNAWRNKKAKMAKCYIVSK
jgi:hypothetical protein